MARASRYQTHRGTILQVLGARESAHSQSPTVRELAEAVGVSVSTMHSYLSKLKEEGEVEWNPKQHRSLRLHHEVSQQSSSPVQS